MGVILFFFFWGGGVGGRGRGVGLGGQGGCERRTEVFVKIQKKKKMGGGSVGGVGGSGWEVRVDVNEELNCFLNSKKKKIFFFGGGGGQGVCDFVFFWGEVGEVGGGGVGLGGIRVDVNEELKFL